MFDFAANQKFIYIKISIVKVDKVSRNLADHIMNMHVLKSNPTNDLKMMPKRYSFFT